MENNSRYRSYFNKASGALREKVGNIRRWMEVYPARMTGLVTLPGDILMGLSGLGLNNWGRIFGGVCGVTANTPLVFWGDRKKTEESGADFQDAPLRQRLAENWKFWKYPWEFQASVNLLQVLSLMLLAGPDTASQAGQMIEADSMVSADRFRVGETAAGAISMFGFLIMYIREEAREKTDSLAVETKRGVRSLKSEFNALAGFAKGRLADLRAAGPLSTRLKNTWNNAIDAISQAGPNTVAGKVFLVGLVPYTVESLAYRDWHTLGSCLVYAAASWLIARTSKRAPDNLLPETNNPPGIKPG